MPLLYFLYIFIHRNYNLYFVLRSWVFQKCLYIIVLIVIKIFYVFFNSIHVTVVTIIHKNKLLNKLISETIGIYLVWCAQYKFFVQSYKLYFQL